MSKISYEVELPDRLLQGFLQHIRNFESQHMDEIHIKLWVADTKMSPEQMLALFRSIRPPFPFERVFPRNDA